MLDGQRSTVSGTLRRFTMPSGSRVLDFASRSGDYQASTGRHCKVMLWFG